MSHPNLDVVARQPAFSSPWADQGLESGKLWLETATSPR